MRYPGAVLLALGIGGVSSTTDEEIWANVSPQENPAECQGNLQTTLESLILSSLTGVSTVEGNLRLPEAGSCRTKEQFAQVYFSKESAETIATRLINKGVRQASLGTVGRADKSVEQINLDRKKFLSASAKYIVEFLPDKTRRAAELIASKENVQPGDFLRFCDSTNEIDSIDFGPGFAVGGNQPNYVLPFYRFLLDMSTCETNETPVEITPISIEKFNGQPEKEADVPDAGSKEKPDTPTQEQVKGKAKIEPAKLDFDPLQPHDIVSGLQREIMAIENLKKLWDGLLGIGSKVTDAAAQAVYISALLELKEELALESEKISDDLASIEALIRATLEVIRPKYIKE
jgi:hypothetical protein